jgi:BirA family biotin operon repressor/biotin-[acetyl-CoA-carboxylase] ligase
MLDDQGIAHGKGGRVSVAGVQVRVLGLLLEAGGAVRMEAIGRAAGIDAMAAAKAIDGLREAGCEIDAHPTQGVRLVRSGLGCWGDYIESRHAGRLGRRVLVYRQTTSTQEVARQLLAGAATAHDGTIIVADHQTTGRGRLGRRWLDAAGEALLMTAIVDHAHATVDHLMLASCCGLAQAIERVAGVKVQIRWPNDLLIEGGKVAGILVETIGRAALIGIGVNVASSPDRLPDDKDSPTRLVASLAAAGRMVDRLTLLDAVAQELHRALRETDDRSLVEVWKQRASLLEQRVAVRSGGTPYEGRVIDVDPQAGLMLLSDGGAVVTLPAATTTLVRADG